MSRLLRSVNKASSKISRSWIFYRVIQPTWDRVASLLPLDLTASRSTMFINLELTSRCNLSCVYCSKAFSVEERKRLFDLPLEWIKSSMEVLRERGAWLVSVHGIGESTILKDWPVICETLYKHGLNLTIVTNFARPLSQVDVDTLMLFHSVLVSIDTADSKMFSKIRRGAKLDVLLANVDRVNAEITARNGSGPKLEFDIVVTDKTIGDLENLVRLGLNHGIKEFHFNDLCKGPDAPGDFNVYNATTLPKKELEHGLLSLKRAIGLAKSAGCEVLCQPGLLDSIERCLGEQPNPLPILGSFSWGAPAVGKGMTRDCSLPWQTAMMYADGHVRPCCTSDASVGNMKDASLEAILNGESMRKFRSSLLTGELAGTMCMNCSMAPEVPIKQFKRKMSGRLTLWAIRRNVLNLFSKSN